MAWTWRPYQIECKSSIKKHYKEGIFRHLIVQATGTGKRAAAVDIMRHFGRSLFIAHREELIMQAYEDIEKIYPMQVGIVKGKLFEIDKKIVVASVQTLCNRLGRIDPELFDYLAIDECHHYCAKTYLDTIRHFKPKLQTAWTATPKRLDGLSLTNIADKIVFEYKIEDGIRDGHLAKLDAYQIRTQTDLSKINKVGGDFNQKQLSEAVDSPLRNILIVHKYKQYAEGRQFIAFCASLEHCKDLKEEFDEVGIDTEIVVSHKEICTSEQREDRFRRFKSGKLTGIINIDIATEGFDYSDVGCVLMAKPTQSEAKYVQAVGRGTRLKTDEFKAKFNSDRCIVLDFVDNSGKHSLINSYELEKGKDIEDRMFLPDEHKEKLLEEREKRAAELTIKSGNDTQIDLLRLPEVNVWDSPKMLEIATEKQLDFMRRIGVYEEGIEYTKAMASEAISNSQCTYKSQISWLAKQGYDTSNGVTLGQYQIVKRRYDLENKFNVNK